MQLGEDRTQALPDAFRQARLDEARIPVMLLHRVGWQLHRRVQGVSSPGATRAKGSSLVPRATPRLEAITITAARATDHPTA